MLYFKGLITCLHRSIEHTRYDYIRLSLELCKAYIASDNDIRTKLSHFIVNERVRTNFDEHSCRQREQIIEQLSSSIVDVH
jgi:hypothetical protein